MSCFLAISAALSLILHVDALTDDEIGKFVSRGCGVRYGSCAGEFMYGEVAVTKSTADDTITVVTNSIPDHETCADTLAAGETCYDAPLTTWIEEQDVNVAIPLNPEVAADVTWLPPGATGYAINGVQIFSPYSFICTDALIDEAIGFDDCMGHPQEAGNYHYHASPICLDGYEDAMSTATALFVGVALDGFPIYLEFDDEGELVDNSVLDECHGYDANDGNGYRYIVNDEFPYIIGCFRGTPLSAVQEHCDSDRRRLLSAKEIESIEYRYEQTARRRLLQPPPKGGPGGGFPALQDGCDDACSGDDCGEMASVAMCDFHGDAGFWTTDIDDWMNTEGTTASPVSGGTPAPVVFGAPNENAASALSVMVSLALAALFSVSLLIV